MNVFPENSSTEISQPLHDLLTKHCKDQTCYSSILMCLIVRVKGGFLLLLNHKYIL